MKKFRFTVDGTVLANDKHHAINKALERVSYSLSYNDFKVVS